MDFDDIERILELVREHELAEFELERDGLKLRVRKSRRVAHDVHRRRRRAPQPAPLPPVAAAAPAAAAAAAAPAAAAGRSKPTTSVELAVVKSPIVGTFYRSPSRARRRSSRSASG